MNNDARSSPAWDHAAPTNSLALPQLTWTPLGINLEFVCTGPRYLHTLWPPAGGVRIHPENARMSGRHGVQYVAQCVACAALTLVVWQ